MTALFATPRATPSSSSASIRPLSRREWVLLIGLSGILLLTRLAIARSLQLIPDEALYAYLGAHTPLIWGSFPPGVLLLARLGLALGGHNALTLRLPSVLLTTSALFPFYLLSRALWEERTARYLLLCFASVPVFHFFGSTLTPDGAQLCLWCWLLLACWRALHSSGARDWLLVGVLGGLGLWVKYPLVLFWPSLGMVLAFCPRWRSQAWKVILALGVCALCVLVPLSQHALGAQGLRYQMEGRQQWGAPRVGELGLWYGSHALYYSPLLYLGCLVALDWAWRHGRDDARARFCLSFALPMWLLFALVTAFTRRILHREHWDALAYPPLILLLPYLWQNARRPQFGAGMMRAVPIVALLFVALMTTEATLCFPSRALGKGPLFWHELGWRAMATETDQRLGQMPPNTLVVGESFVNATEYWFYGAHPERARCLDSPYNARFGVALALRNAGLVWPHEGESRRPILSVGGPYSLPPELRLWDKKLRLYSAPRELTSLRVDLNNKLLKTFYYKALIPQKHSSLKSVKERYILLKRRKEDRGNS